MLTLLVIAAPALAQEIDLLNTGTFPVGNMDGKADWHSGYAPDNWPSQNNGDDASAGTDRELEVFHTEACPACDGLGSVFEVDPELVVPDDGGRPGVPGERPPSPDLRRSPA